MLRQIFFRDPLSLSSFSSHLPRKIFFGISDASFHHLSRPMSLQFLMLFPKQKKLLYCNTNFTVVFLTNNISIVFNDQLSGQIEGPANGPLSSTQAYQSSVSLSLSSRDFSCPSYLI